MSNWEKYYELPLTYDGQNYAWCANDTMALTFVYNLSKEDSVKIVDAINGLHTQKISDLRVDGCEFFMGEKLIFTVRGWGYLTGTGACALPTNEATKIQDGFIDFVKSRLTDKKNKYQELEWWGYKHTNGTYHVKRYLTTRDVEEANESDFVENAYGPFNALNRDDAFVILKSIIL